MIRVIATRIQVLMSSQFFINTIVNYCNAVNFKTNLIYTIYIYNVILFITTPITKLVVSEQNKKNENI